MQGKIKLKELIVKAQAGNEDALIEVVQRFIPMVKKYSRQLGYLEASSDLITWIVSAVHRYKPNVMGTKRSCKNNNLENEKK